MLDRIEVTLFKRERGTLLVNRSFFVATHLSMTELGIIIPMTRPSKMSKFHHYSNVLSIKVKKTATCPALLHLLRN